MFGRTRKHFNRVTAEKKEEQVRQALNGNYISDNHGAYTYEQNKHNTHSFDKGHETTNEPQVIRQSHEVDSVVVSVDNQNPVRNDVVLNAA